MDEVKKILKTVRYCSIATVNKDNMPWNSPVFYVYDENLNLYWWSDSESVHSQNIANNSSVFAVIFDSNAFENNATGVYLKGEARIVKDPEAINSVISLYNKSSKVFKLNDSNTTGKAPTRIFQLNPESIWTNAEGQKSGFYVDVRKQVWGRSNG